MKDGTFQGMPSPFGALTVVSIVLLELPFVATLLAIIGTAWLMVSRVEYPKPRGRLAVAMLSWIVAGDGAARRLGLRCARRAAAAADRAVRCSWSSAR